MSDLSVLKGAVLHGGEEIPEPAQWLTIESCIELVPENERHLPGQADVPHLVQGIEQAFVAADLGEVEFQRLDAA